MKVKILEDIPTGTAKSGKPYYARKNDKAYLITIRDDVLILEINGERFPCKTEKTNYKP